MLSRMTKSGARLLTAPFYAMRNISASYFIDTRGNTPLHIALHQNKINQVDDFLHFSQSYPPHAIYDMTKRVNHTGYLPIDCIDPQESADTLRLANAILDHMPTDDTDRPRCFLREDEVLAYHGDRNNPDLNEHLKLGVALVNAARERVLTIPNHPRETFPHLSETDAHEVVYQMRAKLSYRLHEDYATSIFEKAVLAGRLRIGYCSEMTASVLYALAERSDIDAHGETVEITNGDHDCVVLGRNLKSVEHLPATWGGAAVIADAWTPAVYPVAVLFDAMRDYRGIRMPAGLGDVLLQPESIVPKVTYLNPQFHRIRVTTTANQSPIYAGSLKNLGLFKQAKLRLRHEENYTLYKLANP